MKLAKKYTEYICTISPGGGANVSVVVMQRVDIRLVRVSYHVDLSVVCPSGAGLAGCQSLMIFLDTSDRNRPGS